MHPHPYRQTRKLTVSQIPIETGDELIRALRYIDQCNRCGIRNDFTWRPLTCRVGVVARHGVVLGDDSTIFVDEMDKMDVIGRINR